MICRFIDDHKNRFGVEPICRVLTEHGCKIAPSTYYAWRSRRPSTTHIHEAHVRNAIHDLRTDANGNPSPESLYGYRKTWHALRAAGVQVGRATVARVMRQAGWRGVVRGKRVRTTTPEPGAPRAADLLNRQFRAPAPNHAWVADFTYVRTWAGFVYVAFIVDVYAQRIVGWHAATTKHQDLVTTALRMAIWTRNREGHPIPHGLIHHSDAGSQYTGLRFTERLDLEGMRPSIGTVGDAYDNALMETIIGLYKTECIATSIFHTRPYKSIDDVEYATVGYTDWYNNRRLHSSIGYATPTAHEAEHHATKQTTDTPTTTNH